ncbi:Protein phosphatase 1 regulatory subunit 1B [Chelonia mydas]|uniref:Protein phosphatase 1 regulatory subunit 1B n=1 Tax=Chelonia mydas TaxID=8469 RepID=M7B7C1_CHEMY|nr:Protein phosphatase 1 regulatory subunit 1B [Chelonia mydas]
MDPKDRKKIQFSVPAPPSQLDPRAVDMIRRRRPTPAMLFQMSEHSSPAMQRIVQSHLEASSGLEDEDAAEQEDSSEGEAEDDKSCDPDDIDSEIPGPCELESSVAPGAQAMKELPLAPEVPAARPKPVLPKQHSEHIKERRHVGFAERPPRSVNVENCSTTSPLGGTS